MYYFLYGFLYTLSLIPWRIMYFFSDAIYGLLYYVIGYRKKVVMQNLLIAFPEKTHEERVRICKDFYHNFVDTFLEILKLISISEKELRKRVTSNVHEVNALYHTVPNLAIVSGHFFNWEVGSLAGSLDIKFQLLSVYMPLGNKAFDKLMLKMRTKFGARFLPATNFKEHFIEYADTKYALGLLGDQSPGKPENAYWINFFGRLTPFVKGPEKNSKRNNSAVIFVDYEKPKRGYYHINYIIVTLHPANFAEGALTKKLIELVEKTIRQKPANYLWSHRRWKHDFKEEYRNLVID